MTRLRDVNGHACDCADNRWRANREFCERHQLLYCRVCDGRCPDCRTEAQLGEPDDDDSELEDEP